jgi:hypothetical protein
MAPRAANAGTVRHDGVSAMTDPDVTTLTKICTHCGIEKPATTEYFARQKTGKYGFRADCKECHYARQRNYTRKPSIKIKQEKYRIKRCDENRTKYSLDPTLCEQPDVMKRCSSCKAQLPSTSQYWHKNASNNDGLSRVCKSCITEYRHEYNRRDDIKQRMFEYNKTERSKAYFREYFRRSDVKTRARIKSNQPAEKQRRKEYAKQYWERTGVKEKARLRDYKRRSAPGSFTKADIDDIRKAQGNRCYICHKKLGKKYHIDHFIPIILGGTNDPGNLRLACPRCNLSKGPKHPHDMGILI